jgi:hypothetical protein
MMIGFELERSRAAFSPVEIVSRLPRQRLK